MVDALLSAAAARILALIQEQAKYHVNLVEGAEEEVLSLGEELKNVRYKLNDAEKQSFEKEEINTWLWKLRQTTYEMDDILDEWEYALFKHQKGKQPLKKKVCSFVPSSSFSCFKNVVVRHEIAKKVLNVKAKLDKLLEEEKKYGFKTCELTAVPSPWRDQSTSFVDLAEVHGRGRDVEILVSKLLGNEGSQEESGVVSIVGVGGLGKTTLAQLVYNDSRVQASFDTKIWICVSNPFDLSAIGKGIIRSITGESYGDVDQLEDLFRRVRESTLGKKILLILDDVWTEDYKEWKPLQNILKCGGVGSKILVTTRSIRVAITTGTKDRDTFELGVLSDDECWSILCHMACPEKNKAELEEIGKKIAKKCSGLPLAATTLGGLLRFKRSLREWENVLSSEIWEMSEAKEKLFRPLLMSYLELSQTQKQCFSYCAFFPKDFEIYVESLIKNWMALGYLGLNSGDMELKGRECFNILAHRSLFQDFEKNDLGEIRSCKMHDIVHDFAQYLRKGYEVKGGEMNKRKSCRVCDSSQVSNVNEFCTLYWNGECPPNLCNCFVRSRVLSLAQCGMKSVPQEMENLIHLRCLDLNRNHFSTTGLNIIFQLSYLQNLNLYNCNLEEIPKEIGNLFDLRHLNLSYNRLEVLPSEIGNLKKVRHLDLSSNESLNELPKEIGNLIQLIHLDLSCNKSLKELPNEIGNLIQLRHLNLRDIRSLKVLPNEIGNLIQLTHLNLSLNVSLKELPNEIGNLVQLTHLNLGHNISLKELPNEIGNLIHLIELDLRYNESLKMLPDSIRSLQKLESLSILGCISLWRLPEGLGQLTGLRSLGYRLVLGGLRQIGLIKNLNHLRGSLEINLHSSNLVETVEDAREAELRKKIYIDSLYIFFESGRDESSSSSVEMDVMDVLEPHPNLRKLHIKYFMGSKFPLWMSSPLNQLRKLDIIICCGLMSLPSFGKLPSLEEFHVSRLVALQCVGREFLGITATQGGEVGGESSSNIAFPKLKILKIQECGEWKEWEDIKAEEEESIAIQIMPCLKELHIENCKALTALPHRLLRKASSLEKLSLDSSEKLLQRYNNKEDSLDWKSISLHNPDLQLVIEL